MIGNNRINIFFVFILLFFIFSLFISESAFAARRSCNGQYRIYPKSFRGEMLASPVFSARGGDYAAPTRSRTDAACQLKLLMEGEWRNRTEIWQCSPPCNLEISNYPYRYLERELAWLICTHYNVQEDYVYATVNAYTFGDRGCGCCNDCPRYTYSRRPAAKEWTLAENYRFTCPQRVRIPVEIVNLNLPDFIVTGVFLDRNCKLNYKIKNIGVKHTEQNIDITITSNEGRTLNVTVPAGNLQDAGGEETFRWDRRIDLTKAPFTVTVNPNRSIREVKYDNNTGVGKQKSCPSLPLKPTFMKPR